MSYSSENNGEAITDIGLQHASVNAIPKIIKNLCQTASSC